MKELSEIRTLKVNRYIIIGVNGGIGGCNLPKVEYKIMKDLSQKKYLIEATVFEFGACRRNNHFRRFVCIEKPDDDYRIQFDLKKVFIN